MQVIDTLTCEELFEQWMKYKAIFVDKSSIEWYNGTLTSLRQAGFASKLATIKKVETYDFVLKFKNKLHPETLKRKLENLEACWKWAIEHEYVDRNPWLGLASQIKVPQSVPPKPFTCEEMARIFEAFEASDRYRQLLPFVKFSFWTGLRSGETVGLQWKDFSDDLTQITVSQQFTRKRRKAAKCGKVRSFRLSQSVTQLLKDLKGNRTPKPTDPVFTWNGKLVYLINFRRRVWEPLLEEAGVEYRTFYLTRHTFISHCLEKGINPATIAKITGHNVAVLFNHYAGSLHVPTTPEF